MPFQLVEYEKLKNAIKLGIYSLIKEHSPNHRPDINDLRLSVDEIRVERRYLVLILLDSFEILDAISSQQEKDNILNALGYYIYKKIFDGYKLTRSDNKLISSFGYLLSFFTNENPLFGSPIQGSCFCGSLATALELTKVNKPNDEQKLQMYTLLKTFCTSYGKKDWVLDEEKNTLEKALPKKIKELEIKILKGPIKLIQEQTYSLEVVKLKSTKAGSSISFFSTYIIEEKGGEPTSYQPGSPHHDILQSQYK